MTGRIHEHRRVRLALEGFELRAHEIPPLKVLDGRVGRARRHPLHARRDHERDPGFLQSRLRNPDIGNGEGIEPVRDFARIALAGRRYPAGADHLYIRILQLGAPHTLRENRRHLIKIDGRNQLQTQTTALKAG